LRAPAFGLLRRHVCWCAKSLVAIPATTTTGTSDPKIHQLNVAVAIKHHVFGFKIAVNHALLVRFLQPGTNLPGNSRTGTHVQCAKPTQNLPQALAFYEFHGDICAVFRAYKLVNSADPFMRHFAGQAQFTFESLEHIGIARKFRSEYLQRDNFARLPVSGLVNHSHTTAADLTLNFIAALN